MMGLVLRGSQDPNPTLMFWLGHQEWYHMLMEGDLGLRGILLEQAPNHPHVEVLRSAMIRVRRRTKTRLEVMITRERQQQTGATEGPLDRADDPVLVSRFRKSARLVEQYCSDRAGYRTTHLCVFCFVAGFILALSYWC